MVSMDIINRDLEKKIYEFIKQKGETFLSEISKELDISRITAKTYIMKLLGEGKVIISRKVGKAVLYRAK